MAVAPGEPPSFSSGPAISGTGRPWRPSRTTTCSISSSTAGPPSAGRVCPPSAIICRTTRSARWWRTCERSPPRPERGPSPLPEESPMTTDLLETIKDGVAVLTMNRPDRLNALSGPMLDAMLEALHRLAEDNEVGAVVLTGAGRGFCAGGDVKAMALRSRMETSRLLHEMPKPTIAMVRGAAAGAGLSLALACDLRVASDNA